MSENQAHLRVGDLIRGKTTKAEFVVTAIPYEGAISVNNDMCILPETSYDYVEHLSPAQAAERLHGMRDLEPDGPKASEQEGLPQGWAWSDLAARSIAGSDLAYGLAERMAASPDAYIDGLIQEQASPAMDRAELFEWAMADAANLGAIEDVFDGTGYTEEPFETFEELIEGAYRQTSRSELECCIEQVQRAALYLEASKRLSPNAEVERLALSPSLLAELDAIECTEQTDRLADLDDELASALVSAIGADEPLPNAMTVIQANRLMEARKAFGDFDASLNAAERQASNANDALKADMACRAKAMGSRKDNLGSHAHAASL